MLQKHYFIRVGYARAENKIACLKNNIDRYIKRIQTSTCFAFAHNQ